MAGLAEQMPMLLPAHAPSAASCATAKAASRQRPHKNQGYLPPRFSSYACMRGEWTTLMPYSWQKASTSRR